MINKTLRCSFHHLGLALLMLSSCLCISGCGNSYNAVNEVGYDSPWYVTVVFDNGSRKSVMVEELSKVAQQETTPQAIQVEGIDRRTKKKVLIDIQEALKSSPTHVQIVDRYKTPLADSGVTANE
jgi:hypothetical protein